MHFIDIADTNDLNGESLCNTAKICLATSRSSMRTKTSHAAHKALAQIIPHPALVAYERQGRAVPTFLLIR